MMKRIWEETIQREIKRRQRLSLHATFIVKQKPNIDTKSKTKTIKTNLLSLF